MGFRFLQKSMTLNDLERSKRYTIDGIDKNAVGATYARLMLVLVTHLYNWKYKPINGKISSSFFY